MIERIRELASIRKREALLFVVIFLVATMSFALGYLANREFRHATIVIEKVSQ